MPLYFRNAPTITGNLVSLWGLGVLYNFPGYNSAADKGPYMISICSNSANATMTIRGFSQLTSGNNATEFVATTWLSLNTNAQGWPSEPAC
jgi:hypothetical protein